MEDKKTEVKQKMEETKALLRSVSPTPHVRDKANTRSIMGLVVLALLPATVMGIWNFGPKAILVMVLCILSCVLTEWCFCRLRHRKSTVGDLSAVVTGVLLGLNLPVSVPWWIPVLGGIIAIGVVKMLFGGLGQNFMNPALGARCFLVISFSKYMTDFSYVPGWGGADAVSGATPLARLKAGETQSLMSMFMGNEAGTIGETSALALLLGGCLLLATGVITWHVTGAYIGSLLVFLFLFSGRGLDLHYYAAHVFGGGLLIGAIFMATDYVTRPITRKGQLIYGVFLGCMTGIFRLFGPGAEGVSYAIILGNLLVPLMERITLPVPFGYERGSIWAKKEAAAKKEGKA